MANARAMKTIATLKTRHVFGKDPERDKEWVKVGSIQANEQGRAIVWLAGWCPGLVWGFLLDDADPVTVPHLEGYLTCRLLEGDDAKGTEDYHQVVGYIQSHMDEEGNALKGYVIRLLIFPISQRHLMKKGKTGLHLAIRKEQPNHPSHPPAPPMDLVNAQPQDTPTGMKEDQEPVRPTDPTPDDETEPIQTEPDVALEEKQSLIEPEVVDLAQKLNYYIELLDDCGVQVCHLETIFGKKRTEWTEGVLRGIVHLSSRVADPVPDPVLNGFNCVHQPERVTAELARVLAK